MTEAEIIRWNTVADLIANTDDPETIQGIEDAAIAAGIMARCRECGDTFPEGETCPLHPAPG